MYDDDANLDDQILDADLWEMTRMLQSGKLKAEVQLPVMPREPLKDGRTVFGVGLEYRPHPCPVCYLSHWTDEEAQACCNPGMGLPATAIDRILELIWQGAGTTTICAGLGYCEERIQPIVNMVDTIYMRQYGLYGKVGKQRAANAKESRREFKNRGLRKTWPPTRVPREEIVRRAQRMML